jgi:hypothetical protein
MKNLIKSLLSALLVAGTVQLDADTCSSGSCGTSGSVNNCATNCSTNCSTDCSNGCGSCVTTYIPRSVGDNTAREMQEHYTHLFDQDCFNGGASIVFEYQRSFRGERLAQCLFGDCNLKFVGSDALGTGTRGARDILANNFGLSPEANAAININPRIENFIVDFQGYFGLDNWWNGLYFRAHLPVAHTRWDLRAACGTRDCCTSSCSSNCSTDCSSSSNCSTNCSSNNNCSTNCDSVTSCTVVQTAFRPGCVAPIAAGSIKPAASIQEALGGDFVFGAMQTPWKFGRFKFCRQTDSKLADVDLSLGWNFWNCEDYHLGVYLKYVAPTGTRIDACHAKNAFSPVVGNGRFQELGGGITAHAELWNCDDNHSITMYLEGYAVHKFSTCQVRTFDLKNGCLSRYLLLKEFTRGSTGEFSANGNLISAVNWATRFADVSVDVLGDASLKFVYRHCGWSFGLGYNIYGSTKENVCLKGTFADSSLNNRFFGIKGCSPVQVQGIGTELNTAVPAAEVTSAAGTNAITFNPLAGSTPFTATQSNATIFACGTTDSAQALRRAATAATPNSGFFYADSCVNNLATSASGTATSTLTPAQASSSTAGTINPANGEVSGLTNAPKILNDENINVESAANPRQISNKVFGTLDYEWHDCDWKPFIGILGEGEFASRENCCTLNQWGVGLRGGLSF